jgi:hypothetical protein
MRPRATGRTPLQTGRCRASGRTARRRGAPGPRAYRTRRARRGRTTAQTDRRRCTGRLCPAPAYACDWLPPRRRAARPSEAGRRPCSDGTPACWTQYYTERRERPPRAAAATGQARRSPAANCGPRHLCGPAPSRRPTGQRSRRRQAASRRAAKTSWPGTRRAPGPRAAPAASEPDRGASRWVGSSATAASAPATPRGARRPSSSQTAPHGRYRPTKTPPTQ